MVSGEDVFSEGSLLCFKGALAFIYRGTYHVKPCYKHSSDQTAVKDSENDLIVIIFKVTLHRITRAYGMEVPQSLGYKLPGVRKNRFSHNFLVYDLLHLLLKHLVLGLA